MRRPARLGCVLAAIGLLGPLAPGAAQAYAPRPSVAFQSEKPLTYDSGCHVPTQAITPKTCVSGDANGAVRVLLVGDSHAAHLQPALAAYGATHGIRVTNLTKSSCPIADVTVAQAGTVLAYAQCSKWQARVLAGLRAKAYGHFDVAVVGQFAYHSLLGKRGQRLTGSDRLSAWQAGTTRALRALRVSADSVLIVRDSPRLRESTTACLVRNWPEAGCATPIAEALAPGAWRVERAAAKAVPGTSTVDLSTPYCRSGFCRPVDGAYLAFRDAHHWTRTYAGRVLAPKLGQAVGLANARHGRR